MRIAILLNFVDSSSTGDLRIQPVLFWMTKWMTRTSISSSISSSKTVCVYSNSTYYEPRTSDRHVSAVQFSFYLCFFSVPLYFSATCLVGVSKNFNCFYGSPLPYVAERQKRLYYTNNKPLNRPNLTERLP